MDWLLFAWVAALVVTIGGLFPGAVRLLALLSGGAEPDRALLGSAVFALVLGLVGLVCLAALSVALLL